MINESMVYVILITIAVWISFSRNFRYEKEVARKGYVLERRNGRVTAVGTPFMAIFVISILFAFVMWGTGADGRHILLSQLVKFTLIMSIYYIILLFILPILRKIVSARACAYLWIVPAVCYNFIFVFDGNFFDNQPQFIFRIPYNIINTAGAIVLAVFAVIMAWRIVSHFLFRKEILDNTFNVTNDEILRIWEKEQNLIERKKPIPLRVSDKIASPLTIGLMDKKLVTILPHTHYTNEELTLIFRHELRHVQRLDSETKAFLIFMRAFCWYNPIMWMATRKATEDMELSCDEMVLYNADEDKRRKYAELLLDTATDDRGFTTCLSSSAKTLHYRLKNIMTSRKKLSGAMLIALVMAAIIIFNNTIVISSVYGTIGSVVLDEVNEKYIDLISLKKDTDYKYNEVYDCDEDKLIEYLANVKVTKISENYSFKNDEEKGLYVRIKTEKGIVKIEIMDEIIDITCTENRKASGLYVIEDNIDWELIESCMDFDAENPDPPPVRPTLSMFFDPPLEPYEEALYAQDCVLSIDRDGEKEEYEFETNGWGGLH